MPYLLYMMYGASFLYGDSETLTATVEENASKVIFPTEIPITAHQINAQRARPRASLSRTRLHRGHCYNSKTTIKTFTFLKCALTASKKQTGWLQQMEMKRCFEICIRSSVT